ncbi:hypothetical protein GCK72_002385 [Caenorhabditis remanei]|uniref:CRE-NLP-4 protein n=2 Tax=Caenorhabditis remanei TaxID=31234 RepID=E3LW15_CAERE|nr:hypothetical protein GCK72_002385 [Caenorhabditis remanei]EFP12395.1 CRE-NLP-4 protein [Caenorhabditis remanei]KAF1770566.1 hypothetical protein GCK72_002385 [Caenorhabditis remanei]
MKIILILLAMTAAQAAPLTDFSVYIKGTLLCHEEPYKNRNLEIFSEGERLRYEDDMDRFTKDNGEFSIKAWITTDAYMITPYVMIYHNCWEMKEVPHRCQRKILQPLMPPNVTVDSKTPNENKLYNFGVIDLQFKHPAEVEVHCG